MQATSRRSGAIGFLIRWLITAAALAVAVWLVPGITTDGAGPLLLAALIFGLVNAIIKPIVALLTCPLVILTLGLFVFVINALMLGLTSWIAEQFDIGFNVDGFWAALIGAIIVGIVSWILSAFID